MENKKLGSLLIIISIIFFVFLIYFNSNLSSQATKIGCNPGGECVKIEKNISVTNIAFGFFGFMLALGFYMLFFNKTEQAILKKLEEDKNQKVNDQKFEWVMKALDSYEKSALKNIKENDGITQNTLRIKTNMSKAKLSYVLQELEKRNLIKRIKKGKTLQVFLKI